MNNFVKTYHQLFFTLGVMMFLLRPFLGYLAAGSEGAAGNPLRLNQLTQRLVKKKDEHHEPEAVAIHEHNRSEYALPLPVRILHGLYGRFRAALDKTTFFSGLHLFSSIFKIAPNNHFYRSHSVFRI